MHFFSKEHRFLEETELLVLKFPIGTGIAFAEKYKETGNICKRCLAMEQLDKVLFMNRLTWL